MLCGKVERCSVQRLEYMAVFKDNRFKYVAWDRLLSEYRVINGCWEWTGCTNSGGYGSVSVNSEHWLVHRLAARLKGILHKDATDVMHMCNNKRCFNPAHLRAGSRSENMWHAVATNQIPCGEKHPNTPLLTIDVKEIRWLAANTELSQAKIGTLYGVTQGTIFNILHGRTWAYA